jgi:hypothetical protein
MCFLQWVFLKPDHQYKEKLKITIMCLKLQLCVYEVAFILMNKHYKQKYVG